MFLRDLDVDAISDRYAKTFARENHDRPLLCLAFSNGKRVARPAAPSSMMERWFNFEWRLEDFECGLEEAGFLCEGFPGHFCNLGPDLLAACMGSELEFAPDTSWAKYRVSDWKEEPPLRFHREGRIWREMERFLLLSAERGQGKWLTGSGDLHSNGDGLAALRGPQNLLLDMVDSPEEVKKRLAECHDVFTQVLQAHFDIVHPRSNGMNTSWMGACTRGRYAVIQNDFCCMVGPDMFDEFFKEYVEKEASLLDYSIYHLDGPNALAHTESICASPSLQLVQWVPGEGAKPLHDWTDVLRKIQSLGKGLWLYPSAKDAPLMMEYLQPEGCMYNIWCSSREEAEALLKTTEDIHRRKRRQ